MTITQKLISAEALTAYVEGRGYRARPETYDGEVRAFTILGPRRSKNFLTGENGLYDESRARLYCDGFDYSNRQVAQKKLEREMKKRRADPVV